jgi:hypothetical protein
MSSPRKPRSPARQRMTKHQTYEALKRAETEAGLRPDQYGRLMRKLAKAAGV